MTGDGPRRTAAADRQGARRRAAGTTGRRSRTCATSRWSSARDQALARARDGGTCGRAVAVGGIRAGGSSGGARRARRSHRPPNAGRCAGAHLRAVLHRQMTVADSLTSSSSAPDTPAAKPRSRRRGLARTSGSARCRTDTVAHMPCNPAIGGTAKGHLVREIDALGGLMGRAIDATGIQFKLLNRSRGPAVWSPRAQADKKVYGQWVRRALDAEPNIEWLFGRAGRILVEDGRVVGLTLEDGERLQAAVDRRHDRHVPQRADSHRARAAAGRPLRRAAVVRSRGVAEGARLRVGPPEDRHAAAARPREHRFRSAGRARAISSRARRRPAGAVLVPDRPIERAQIDCYLLHTNDRVRDLVRANIAHSPLFNGQIRGIGPRYCPSLEDKIVRFPDKERHQIFLEPEGVDARRSTSTGFR